MLRGVIYEEEARKACDDAEGKWTRTADAIGALEWGLVHDPTNGAPLTEVGNVRAITLPGGRSIDLPTVTAVYEITEQNIIVRAIGFEDAQTQVGRA